jgi:hypothetical protein
MSARSGLVISKAQNLKAVFNPTLFYRRKSDLFIVTQFINRRTGFKQKSGVFLLYLVI